MSTHTMMSDRDARVWTSLDNRGTTNLIPDIQAHAAREARRILAETEPGFNLSGGHKSRSTGPRWSSAENYIGHYDGLSLGPGLMFSGTRFDAFAALADSLAAFCAAEDPAALLITAKEA